MQSKMSIILRQPSKHLSNKLHCSLFWARLMGGGPRTFSGELNKWQWKRLHEKKAPDKEKRLLDKKQQLYQARRRTQIRATVSDRPGPVSRPAQLHSPLSPRDHVRALVDRFVKLGAEDLWNEADGPARLPTRPHPCRVDAAGMGRSLRGHFQQKRGYCSVNSMNFGNFIDFGKVRVLRSDLRRRSDDCCNSIDSEIRKGIKLSDLANVRVLGCNYSNSINVGVFNGGNLSYLVNARGFGCNVEQRRGFSSNVREKFKPKANKRRYVGSSSDDDEGYGVVSESARWPKFSVEGAGKGRKEEVKEGRRGSARGFIGSVVLGKHDVKVKRKRILKELEDYAEEEEKGEGLRDKVEEIRREVVNRKLGEKAVDENASDVCDDDEVVDDFVAGEKRFDECGSSPLTVKALTTAGYVTMSRVQEETLSHCLEGKDVLVKARAGTGKTIAFLLPAIEAVLKAISSDKVPRVSPIYVLVLCPTRELASQIAAETRVLLKYHDGLGVQVLVGGTRFKDDLKHLESDPCQILVATPGRLLDHIESRSGLSVRLMGLKMLVLDEADHLLDLGFRKDMERIVDCLPRRRQSLLFSATVPKEVRRVSQLVLNREHVCVNTIDAGSPETNFKIKQSYIVAPHDTHFQVVYQLLREHVTGTPDYKVIVFCTTGMVTSVMYNLFREMRLNVREIHSRKQQLYRSRIADEFKLSKRLILISSDVSARGVNYPDVSLVIQVGIPSNRAQYIHRIGRTGREGKDGEGILVLAPWEEHFLTEIRDLHVERSAAPIVDPEVKQKIEDSMSKVDTSVKEAAYHAWLGYYNSIRETGRDKTSLVKWANQFSESIGLPKPPGLFRKTLVKMGLKDIPGIRPRK